MLLSSICIVTVAILCLVNVSGLAPTSSSSVQKTRREAFFSSLALLSPCVLTSNAWAEEQPSPKPDASVFLGTYTDPNHPGGTRTIELTGTGFAGFQLATVTGGGGEGEPESFELPAMIFDCPGNRAGLGRASSGKLCITIDFTPKGGPKDFTGYWDESGIRFILDQNFWPKQK